MFAFNGTENSNRFATQYRNLATKIPSTTLTDRLKAGNSIWLFLPTGNVWALKILRPEQTGGYWGDDNCYYVFLNEKYCAFTQLPPMLVGSDHCIVTSHYLNQRLRIKASQGFNVVHSYNASDWCCSLYSFGQRNHILLQIAQHIIGFP